MTIKAIWAQTSTGGIGYKGKLPFYVSGDLKHFKLETVYNIVVMGYNTYASLGFKPLRDRINIVLTSKDLSDPNVLFMKSVEEVIQFYNDSVVLDLYVIGGAQVYKAFEPYIEECVVSMIEGDWKADTYSPLNKLIFVDSQEEHSIKKDGFTVRYFRREDK